MAGVASANFNAGAVEGGDTLEVGKHGPDPLTVQEGGKTTAGDGRSSEPSTGAQVGANSQGPNAQVNAGTKSGTQPNDTREGNGSASAVYARSERGIAADRNASIVNNNAVSRLTGMIITVNSGGTPFKTRLSESEAQSLVSTVFMLAREKGMMRALQNYK